jgi:glutaredoxin
MISPYVRLVQGNISNESDIVKKLLEKIHPTVYVLTGCHYCKLFKEVLEPFKDFIDLKDINDEGVKEEIEELNIQGFPTSFNPSNKKSVAGYTDKLYTWLLKLQ